MAALVGFTRQLHEALHSLCEVLQSTPAEQQQQQQEGQAEQQQGCEGEQAPAQHQQQSVVQGSTERQDQQQQGEVQKCLVALAGVLGKLGAALSTLPISSACNNPWCVKVSECCEQRVVRGSARMCSGCRTARYCSRECQTQH